MDEFISREAAIAYIREQSEECQKAFEELGGESGIYADAYNDLAEDFYSIPAADVAPVVHARWIHSRYEDCSEQFELVKCSQCNHEAYAMAFYVRGGNYCPACGAKMDGGVGDAKSV